MSSVPKRVPPSRISSSHVLAAAKALLRYNRKKREELRLKDLLEEGEDIQLGITFQKAGTKKSTKPTLFELPHPFVSSSREICLIIRDDDNLKSDIKDLNLRGVRKIMQFKKVKILSALYEERTKFCDSFDLFIADDIIYPLAKARLGKHFWRTKKMPLPVPLSKPGNIKNLKDQIEKIHRSTIFYLPSSSFVAVKIGNTSQSPREITENIMSIMDNIIMKMDPINGWDIIQNLTIKTQDSLAFPFFNQIPSGPTPVSISLTKGLKPIHLKELETTAKTQKTNTNKKVGKNKKQIGKKTPTKEVKKSGLKIKAHDDLQSEKSKKRKLMETETEKVETPTPKKVESTTLSKNENKERKIQSPNKNEKKELQIDNKPPKKVRK